MFLLDRYVEEGTFHVEADHPIAWLQNGGKVAKAFVFGRPLDCRLVQRAQSVDNSLLAVQRGSHPRPREEVLASRCQIAIRSCLPPRQKSLNDEFHIVGFHEFGRLALGLKSRFVDEFDLDTLLNDSLQTRWAGVVGVFPPCYHSSWFGAVKLSPVEVALCL